MDQKGLFYKGPKSWLQWVGKYDADDQSADDQPETAADSAVKEHEELDAEIKRLWAVKFDPEHLDASIRSRFQGKGLNDLTFIQKRQILSKMKESDKK